MSQAHVPVAAAAAAFPSFARRWLLAPVWRRYWGLLITMALFVLMVAAILGFGIWSSAQMTRDSAVVSQANRLNNEALEIQADLLTLQALQMHAYKRQDSAALRDKLLQKYRDFNQGLEVFTLGGTLKTQDGNMLKVAPLKEAKTVEALNRLKSVWSPLSDAMQVYQNANSEALQKNALALAVEASLESKGDISRLSQSFAGASEESFRRSLVTVSRIQTAGIVAALLYFLVFVWFVINRLGKADARIAAARREVQDIMTTVNSGLFLLDENMHIGTQYSKQLETLLGSSDLAGKSLEEVLAPLIDAKKLKNTRSFVKQLYNRKILQERMVEDLNPLRRLNIGSDGQERYLDFRFRRVWQNGKIVRVLATVSDITAEVLLAAQQDSQSRSDDMKLDMLQAFIQADTELLGDYLNRVAEKAEWMNTVLKKSGQSQPVLHSKTDELYRQVHRLKGEAQALKLGAYSQWANKTEALLKQLRNKPELSGEDFLPVTLALKELMELNAVMQELAQKFLPQALSQPGSLSPSLSLLQYLTAYAEDLAARHGKHIGLSMQGGELINEIPAATLGHVRETLVQLIRNAVVHGIETPEKRQQTGKSRIGHLHVFFQSDGHYLCFGLEDDGAGIDEEKVRHKAVRTGLLSAEEAPCLERRQIYAFLFKSGFSTLNEAGEDAGHGMGLDAVAALIRELKGKVHVHSENGILTRFAFALPLPG